MIGAMEDGQPLGAALWELEASRARLLSIAVESKHRRMGIGTAILRYSMKVLHQLDCYGVYALVLPEKDNAFQPSRYTQKMIQRLDKKIEKQKIFVESEYQKVLNPVQDEMMSEKIKKIDAVCQKFSVLADEIKEMRKNLEGLQGEELETEKNVWKIGKHK